MKAAELLSMKSSDVHFSLSWCATLEREHKVIYDTFDQLTLYIHQ